MPSAAPLPSLFCSVPSFLMRDTMRPWRFSAASRQDEDAARSNGHRRLVRGSSVRAASTSINAFCTALYQTVCIIVIHRGERAVGRTDIGGKQFRCIKVNQKVNETLSRVMRKYQLFPFERRHLFTKLPLALALSRRWSPFAFRHSFSAETMNCVR